jgi:hypothetical protein
MMLLRPLVFSAFTVVAVHAQPLLDTLVATYPEHLASSDQRMLIWKDGTRMPISDGRVNKTFKELLENPDIKDQFAIPYPLGMGGRPPVLNDDPGRIRNEAFFLKMYGDCRKGEVAKHLKSVEWLPHFGGGSVMVTTINGVAERLAAISHQLETLPSEMIKYVVPSAGAYNCRVIAGTDRLSVHAYGAAIDINTHFSDYWLWSARKLAWRNRIPLEIAEVFENHGFIWGGKWYHFDTMHFEYRPEIIAFAKQGWPVSPSGALFGP